jgi:hypothetical protein
MTTFQKLDRLTALARENKELRQQLLATKDSAEPLWEFCKLAQKAGVELYAGELFAVGEEYCDNQCKSTNGGNPSPYYSFNDAYENFIESIK